MIHEEDSRYAKIIMHIGFLLFDEKENIMHIKFSNQNQFLIFKNMNPYLQKYRIPDEVICEIDNILSFKKSNDYIALITEPVQNDTTEILKELRLHEPEVKIPDDNFHSIPIKGKKHRKYRKMIWTWFDILIPDDDQSIFVVYPMKKKDLYRKGD